MPVVKVRVKDGAPPCSLVFPRRVQLEDGGHRLSKRLPDGGPLGPQPRPRRARLPQKERRILDRAPSRAQPFAGVRLEAAPARAALASCTGGMTQIAVHSCEIGSSRLLKFRKA